MSHRFERKELDIVRAIKLTLEYFYYFHRAKRLKQGIGLVQPVGNSSRRCSWLGLSPFLCGTTLHHSCLRCLIYILKVKHVNKILTIVNEQ